MPDAGYRMPDAGCRIPDAGYRIPDTGYPSHPDPVIADFDPEDCGAGFQPACTAG
jgi:hypothetical protein